MLKELEKMLLQPETWLEAIGFRLQVWESKIWLRACRLRAGEEKSPLATTKRLESCSEQWASAL